MATQAPGLPSLPDLSGTLQGMNTPNPAVDSGMQDFANQMMAQSTALRTPMMPPPQATPQQQFLSLLGANVGANLLRNPEAAQPAQQAVENQMALPLKYAQLNREYMATGTQLGNDALSRLIGIQREQRLANSQILRAKMEDYISKLDNFKAEAQKNHWSAEEQIQRRNSYIMGLNATRMGLNEQMRLLGYGYDQSGDIPAVVNQDAPVAPGATYGPAPVPTTPPVQVPATPTHPAGTPPPKPVPAQTPQEQRKLVQQAMQLEAKAHRAMTILPTLTDPTKQAAAKADAYNYGVQADTAYAHAGMPPKGIGSQYGPQAGPPPPPGNQPQPRMDDAFFAHAYQGMTRQQALQDLASDSTTAPHAQYQAALKYIRKHLK